MSTYGRSMRRAAGIQSFVRPLVAALVGGLLVAGCSSGSQAKKTVTVVNTVTGGSVAASAPNTPSSVVVVSSSRSVPVKTTAATAATSSSKPKPTPKPTTSSAAAIVKVDPLKSDCSTLLDSADVKKAIGATVPDGSVRKKDVANPARGITGKIRCYYPKADAKGTAPIVVALTQYANAAAAAKQIATTVTTETEAGAVVSAPKINGYPGHVLLRAGGLVNLQYGTWTLAIAVGNKLAGNAALNSGLPKLAGQVLARVIKNG